MLSTNLHAPVFDKMQYEARVSENLAPGQRVIQVRATDKDQGVYGQISYSLVSQSMLEKFHINNLTGREYNWKSNRTSRYERFNRCFFLQAKL